MRSFELCLLTFAACLPGFAAKPSAAAAAIPAWFEELPGGVYAARGTDGQMALKGPEARLAFRTGPGANEVERLGWKLIGANPDAPASGGAKREAKSDYFTGRDRSQWRFGAPHFGEVRVTGAYRGIDVVWYASGRLLEYDFVVAPGADPKAIRFQLEGAKAKLTGDGGLEYSLGGVKVKQERPVAYQVAGGTRKPVDANYRLLKDGSVRIQLGAYDRNSELVIDPVLSYSGYLGGTGNDVATGVAIDAAGAVWVAGTTTSDVSSDWVRPPFDSDRNGGKDAFLARMVPDAARGWKLDHYTYIGGSDEDNCAAITMAPDGIIYMAGMTYSLDFPLAGNAHQTENKGDAEAFVVRYNPLWEGAFALEYASYLGTTAGEFPTAVAANLKGMVAVVGWTEGGELPAGALNGALQPSNRGGADAFVYTFDTNAEAGSTLLNTTLFGGNSTDIANAAAMDEDGRVYIAGVTMSSDLPLEGGSYQAFNYGNGDGFLAIIDPKQASFDGFKYATYYGGSELDVTMGMKLSKDGTLLLTGYTVSDDFPRSTGAFQTIKNGYVDAWVSKLDPKQGGAAFVQYSSLIGGVGTDVGYAIEEDASGSVTIAGYTDSYDYPVKNPPIAESAAASGMDGFVTSLNLAKTGAEAINYSALYGGRGIDVITAIDIAADGGIALAGYSTSKDLVVTAGGAKPNAAGLKTSFFVRLAPDPKP
jgi:hypothetical protein